MFSLCGLGWDFGEGVYTPPTTRPQERKPFLHATLSSFLAAFLLLDIIDSAIKLVPGVGDPFGGSIFFPDLPSPSRYIVSTTIHVLTGAALVAGFGMVYNLMTLFAVAVLGHSPSAWPPVMDNPWASQSLHEFWAKRWHQLFRQTFLIFGGNPGARLVVMLASCLARSWHLASSTNAPSSPWDVSGTRASHSSSLHDVVLAGATWPSAWLLPRVDLVICSLITFGLQHIGIYATPQTDQGI